MTSGHSVSTPKEAGPPREELLNGHARRRFPTGMVFTYEPRDFHDAREVMETFR